MAMDDARGEHEVKFVVSAAAAGAMVNWLRCRCRPDPAFPAGIVSSIYYDTPDWRFLREKLNSDYLKRKVRVRWYADIESGRTGAASFLETKFKIGAGRIKTRCETAIPGESIDAAPLTDSWLVDIPRGAPTGGVALRGPLLPVFKICYRRRRFLEPVSGARLNFDDDIRVTGVNWRMVPRMNPFSLRTAVFELKGARADLPAVLHPITALGCRKRSFSKYRVCYAKVMRIAV